MEINDKYDLTEESGAFRNRSSSLISKKKTLFGVKKIQYEELIRNFSKSCQNLEEELNVIQLCISLRDEAVSTRAALCSNLDKFLKKNSNVNLKCSLFGSSVNGMGFIDSDVDIRLILESSENGFSKSLIKCLTKSDDDSSSDKIRAHFEKHILRSKDQKAFAQRMSELKPSFDSRSKDVVEALRKLMVGHSTFSDVTGFSSGRNSLLKFSFANHPCEISLGGEIALLNTIFVKNVLTSCPTLAALVATFNFIFKTSYYFASAALSKISSYCTFCIVASILCDLDCDFKKSLKFCIKFFYKAEKMKKFDLSKIPIVQISDSSAQKDYLMDLVFDALVDTDFSTHVFSLYLGGVVPFTALYIPQCCDNFTLSELNIQDPFELDHNIAGNISKVSGWRKELTRLSSIFKKYRRLNALYLDLPGVTQISKSENTEESRPKSDAKNCKSVEISVDFCLVQIIYLEPKKRKKNEEFFPEDFKLWSFNALKAVIYCLKSVYVCVIPDENLKLLETENKQEIADFSWPFLTDCLFERDVWRGRRNIKQTMFPRNHKTEICDEEKISKILYDRRTTLAETVKLQFKFDTQFKGQKLKVEIFGQSLPAYKKCCLPESFDTLLLALFKKLMENK